MNIGIIGIGNLGYGLSNYFSDSGHVISISDKDTKKIETIGYQTYLDNVELLKNHEYMKEQIEIAKLKKWDKNLLDLDYWESKILSLI